MEFNKLNSWLSLTANLGVIAGIIFLAIEIDQNNKLLRAESSFNMLQNRLSLRFQSFEDPDIAAMMFKAENQEPLTELERYRLKERIEGLILGWEWEYERLLEGNIEEIPFAAWRSALNSPLFEYAGWQSVEPLLSPEFLQFLNENIVEQ